MEPVAAFASHDSPRRRPLGPLIALIVIALAPVTAGVALARPASRPWQAPQRSECPVRHMQPRTIEAVHASATCGALYDALAACVKRGSPVAVRDTVHAADLHVVRFGRSMGATVRADFVARVSARLVTAKQRACAAAYLHPRRDAARALARGRPRDALARIGELPPLAGRDFNEQVMTWLVYARALEQSGRREAARAAVRRVEPWISRDSTWRKAFDALAERLRPTPTW